MSLIGEGLRLLILAHNQSRLIAKCFNLASFHIALTSSLAPESHDEKLTHPQYHFANARINSFIGHRNLKCKKKESDCITITRCLMIHYTPQPIMFITEGASWAAATPGYRCASPSETWLTQYLGWAHPPKTDTCKLNILPSQRSGEMSCCCQREENRLCSRCIPALAMSASHL